MPSASLRFHAQLNDFLPRMRRNVSFVVSFNGHESIKHIIEVVGVPHTEVDVILINGKSVGFDRKPGLGDHIDVFPDGIQIEVDSLLHLRPVPNLNIHFVLDGHLGKLATYMRLLGFDSLYRNNYEDLELADISSRESRWLLTRDRGLLKRAVVRYGYWVREKNPQKQLVEIVKHFGLDRFAVPFSRCPICNGLLRLVDKLEVIERLEPKTIKYYEVFRICEKCDQVYWKGSHFNRMERFIGEVLNPK